MTNTKSIAERFFTDYFGTANGTFLVLWTKQDKLSYSFKIPDEIAKAADTAAQLTAKRKDVYFNVCPSTTICRGAKRGKTEDAAALVATWADIDLAYGIHNAHSTYPPNIEEVKKAFSKSPPPSIVVHSGGGLHLYWLLEEPFFIRNAETRQQASGLAKAWQKMLRGALDEHGYDMDSTADLARMLRVPGTLNYKDPQHPKPVTIISGLDGQEDQ